MKSKKNYCISVIVVSSIIFFLLNHLLFLQSPSPHKNRENLDNFSNISNIRAVWVPYIDLNINSDVDTEQKFKEKFDDIIKKAKEFNINVIVAHVRSHGDSYYKSKIFPWTHFLTGIQGQDPGFDPLEYMVQKTHENNMKFHAWINPLRVKSETIPNVLSPSNQFYKFDKNYFLYHTDGISFNPAYQEIRDLITENVTEIIQNYSIDAIHFDDYFYPEIKNLTSPDQAYVNNKLNNNLDEITFRQNNISALIEQVYKKIKMLNPDIEFGVSPPGNLKKCKEVGIDLKYWCDKKIVDYLCPQIYWSLNFKRAPFENIAKIWRETINNKQIKLYSGIALYKIHTDLDNGTWLDNNNILIQEINISNKLNYDGIFLYSYKQICNNNNYEEINILKNFMSKLPN